MAKKFVSPDPVVAGNGNGNVASPAPMSFEEAQEDLRRANAEALENIDNEIWTEEEREAIRKGGKVYDESMRVSHIREVMGNPALSDDTPVNVVIEFAGIPGGRIPASIGSIFLTVHKETGERQLVIRAVPDIGSLLGGL